MEYQKVKSVAKQITPAGERLSRLVLSTTKTIADIVGSTLGPGGRQVLIERFEHAMPPMVTKDGVTVFRSLGFEDAAQHCVMETMRDAAVRTASEAGDGTTTATILADAIARRADEFCTRNRRFSPQRVNRRLERVFRETVEPCIRNLSVRPDATVKSGKDQLRAVARVSANGDAELADAVIQCFDLVGDEGNVTIVESSGPSSYEVEQVDGFPIPMGYEESCAKFYPMFINDPGRQMTYLENPVYVLYHGVLTDVLTALSILEKVGVMFEALVKGEQKEYRHHNVVFVAVGFSEQVLATFGAGFQQPNALKIFPLTVPKSPMPNYQTQFLDDLAAVTGATVFDPIQRPLDTGTLEDLGPGTTAFEASRFRSAVLGRAAALGEPWETRLLDRVDVVTQQLQSPESEVDKILLQERLGKLTGGIAKLRVVGASNGELKEKRDRAEDAVCAVRGAIKHGCLPGGGWALMKVVAALKEAYPGDEVVEKVLKPALMEPVFRLLLNCGFREDEFPEVLAPVLEGIRDGKHVVYDALEQRHGDAFEIGILDSTPAVLEAVRNSISIASLMGTLGGTVVQARDGALERSEARSVQQWMRDASSNPADERA